MNFKRKSVLAQQLFEPVQVAAEKSDLALPEHRGAKRGSVTAPVSPLLRRSVVEQSANPRQSVQSNVSVQNLMSTAEYKAQRQSILRASFLNDHPLRALKPVKPRKITVTPEEHRKKYVKKINYYYKPYCN